MFLQLLQNICLTCKLNNQVFARWKPPVFVLRVWKTPGFYTSSPTENNSNSKKQVCRYIPSFVFFLVFFFCCCCQYSCAIILTGLSNFPVDIEFWPVGLGDAEMQCGCLATWTHQFVEGDEHFLRNVFLFLLLNEWEHRWLRLWCLTWGFETVIQGFMDAEYWLAWVWIWTSAWLSLTPEKG